MQHPTHGTGQVPGGFILLLRGAIYEDVRDVPEALRTRLLSIRLEEEGRPFAVHATPKSLSLDFQFVVALKENRRCLLIYLFVRYVV